MAKARPDRQDTMQHRPQTEQKHPERYARDLSPDHLAGQNIGAQDIDASDDVRPASDIKELTTALRGFTMDELREVPVLPEGARLQQGATYIDLRDEHRRPFTATGEMSASEGSWVVPKAHVPFEYWNRLTETAGGGTR
ncbi:MAG: hypothetical protein ACOC1F_09285 [Myxococcota bacterium]